MLNFYLYYFISPAPKKTLGLELKKALVAELVDAYDLLAGRQAQNRVEANYELFCLCDQKQKL